MDSKGAVYNLQIKHYSIGLVLHRSLKRPPSVCGPHYPLFYLQNV